ncbi:MAG: hypothetical protein KKA73_28100 [Chloroflexi bacterium]|nr:hypothetical protein [Chloroflexota bacterium]MBU1751558.1 hypothetical protein [Chloroflexota bacterium]
MATRDLIKKWDEALATALSARQSQLDDRDLEVASGPDAMAMDVRSGLVAGGSFTKSPTCGCSSLMCSISYCP